MLFIIVRRFVWQLHVWKGSLNMSAHEVIIVNIVNKLSIVWILFKQNGTPALKPSKRQTMDY